jgi:hypothetical protein
VAVTLLATVPPSTATAAEFPGVTKYQYYSQVARRLRTPMMIDGVLIDDEISWRDKSVFSNALYLDLLPAAASDAGALGLLTAGATWGNEHWMPYVLVGGAVGYPDPSITYARAVSGLRYQRPIWEWLKFDAYAQVELDTRDGFDWEFGLEPLRSRWFSLGALVHLHLSRLDVFETNLGVSFVRLNVQALLDSGTSRYAIATSLRELRRFRRSPGSASFDVELQVALVRGGEALENIFETRAILYASTVGGGPRGEARPGFHLHLSHITPNSSGYQGFGIELGFGAKQYEAARSQALYFTAFYNYAGYFYRYPSLRAGIGLVGEL